MVANTHLRMVKIGISIFFAAFITTSLNIVYSGSVHAVVNQGDGMTLYGESTVTTPRYNIFNSGQFGAEATGVAAAATIRHTVIKAAPTEGSRNEMIAGIQTTGGQLYIQRWDGTSWTNEWNVTVGDSNLPRFDIEYEQTSGRAVVVYSGNIVALNELQYRTYNGTSWTGATNLDTSRTAGAVDAVKLEARSGSNDIGLAWADNLWDLSANFWDATANSGAGGWVGEPAAALSANLSRIGAPAACLTTATCMTSWSYDLAFESTSGELVVGWGTEAASDPTFQKRTAGAGGAWSGTNVAGTTAVEEATDMELNADPNSNFIGYANISGESTASAASPDQEAGMWDGGTDTYGNSNNGDTAAGLVESGTNNVTTSWVRDGTTDVFVVVYDDATAAVNFRYFNKNTSVWAAGTDFTGATAPAAAQKMLRMRNNPFNTSELMLVMVDLASDVFTKKLVYGGGTTFTWTSVGPSNGTAAHELTSSSITGMSADYAYNKYIPPTSYTQSAYRWFENQNGATTFDTDGVVDGAATSNTAYTTTKDDNYLYVGGTGLGGYRIEKRNLITGALVTAFDTDGVISGITGSNLLRALVVDSNYLYTFGDDSSSNWRIEKRDITTGALVTAFDSDGVVDGVAASGNAYALTIDSNYLYIAGGNSSSNWRIEKRDITTGALVTAFDSDGVVDGVAASLTAQSITKDANYIYIAGLHDNGTERLEKRDLTTGALVTAFDTDGVVDNIAGSGGGNAIKVDSNYLYVASEGGIGNWRIEKRDITTGALVTAFDTDGVVDGVTASDAALALTIDSNYLYIAGDDSSSNWRIEKRDITTGALVTAFDTDGVVDGVTASNTAYAMTTDLGYLYIVGDIDTSDFRIEKRDIITGALANGTVANIDVGTPLANQDTIATAPVQGTPFRLRMNLHIGTRDLAQSGQSFKLQFAGKGAGSCAVPSGTPSSYTDVTTSTAIKYYDNSNPADGTAFTPNSGDPAHASDILKRQTYEEANNFTNSVSAINLGEDGMWDFALTDNTAPAGTSYCFRAVKSDGTAINTYTQYAQVTTNTGGNTAPGTPTSLAQKKTSDVVIATGGWTTETSIKLTATVSDTDGGDTVKICAEVKAVAAALTSPAGDGDGCTTTGVSSGGTATVTISGLSANTEYHWQIKAKDAAGAYSAWTGYGGNTENPPTNPAARDFGIDVTAPATATVFDNTNTITQPSTTDAADNGDGSLTTLSATWNTFDGSISGIQKYEYSIGITAGGTTVKAWTDNGTATTIRVGSLSLQTSKTYFINVRAIDNAGNVSSVASSNGQVVNPTISFDIDVSATDSETSPPYAINFGNLAGGNVSDSPLKVWVDFDSNGASGGRVYVTGAQSGLHSPQSSFTISAVTGDLTSLSTGFGAQGSSATQGSGGPFNISSLYNVSGNNVGITDTSIRDIFSSSAPITAGRGSFLLKAKPSVTTPASTDYSETLTLIASPSY